MDDCKLIKYKVDDFCRIATLVTLEEAKALVDEFARMESLMPIVDPSGWIDISTTITGLEYEFALEKASLILASHKAVAIAFLKFRSALEELKES